jgi:O-antigen/teichoic acid export membrane protein
MSFIHSIKSKAHSILLKSEKYLHTDAIYLTKGSFWLFTGQAFSFVISFLLALAFANLIPKETYGEYRYLLSLAGLIAIFSLSGMNYAVTQATARGFEGVFKKSISVQLKWGAVMFIAAAILAVYYFINGNFVLAIGMLVAGIFSPLINVYNTYSAYLNGKKKFKKIAIYNGGLTIFASLFIFLSILFFKSTIPIVLAYFIFNAIATFYFYHRTLVTETPNNKEDSGEAITYGKHVSFMSAFNVFSQQLDKILTFHFLGASALAIYAFALLIPDNLSRIYKNLGYLILPKFSEKNIQEDHKLKRKMVILGIFTIALIATYIIISPFVFKLFFPNYIEAVPYSRVLVFGLVEGISVIPLNYFGSKLLKNETYYYNIFTSLLRSCLLFLGIYFYGLWGLVIGDVAASILNVIYAFYLSNKTIPRMISNNTNHINR